MSEKYQLDQIENDRLATIIDFNICNIHGKHGRMRLENCLSCGRGGGLWWPAGLLL